ncbi:cytochrome P450 [Punctularia strigosozonata HHB-11173 SS5]|uniref:cytochrome P450 n=1 Tax=Punctularia strigosozonata (strain HHB-11173) TaxID=741275 RepID=UPI0004418359|nr:cytochrome P450 [Punctularia strigosozonata HHB-11173 SS5]EIN07525.1 cytochrome P450 [Punctularia strigosozonata HHB-11173 SS5]
MVLSAVLCHIGTAVALYVALRVLCEVWERARSPLRQLQGPPSPSWFFGLNTGDSALLQDSWLKEYGTTLKVGAFFRRDRLCTVDPRALNHILTHSADYQKPSLGRDILSRVVGEGLLLAEGDAHRRQRRVMNPGFGPAQVRGLTSIFIDKATQLRDAWLSELQGTGGTGPVRLDALSWLSRATLDMIGLAGFDYHFESLEDEGGKPNELHEAMATMLSASSGARLWMLLQARIPLLRWVATKRDRQTIYAQSTMKRIGYGLIAERKAALRAEKHGAHVEKADVQGRDLLSLLIKANMAVDIPDDQQIPTFLVAGHETTSTGTTWALFALTQDKNVQRKLREELFTMPTTLRVHPPVGSTTRVAMKDDLIPVSGPYADKHGKVYQEIRVKKGDHVQISIVAVNRASHIWGDDAHEFKPERWLEPGSMPNAPSHNPGVWGNMLSFLGGPRACIGYRFSLVEMKALLFVLVRAFEFKLAIPSSEISKTTAVVTRPMVKSERKHGNQLPLLVKPYFPSAASDW